MKFLPLAIAFPLLLLQHTHAQEQGVHLFILSGQSNMAGMAPNAGFVPETESLFGAGKAAYVKLAIGGQPIRHWVKTWDAIAAKHGIDAKPIRERDNRPKRKKNKGGKQAKQPAAKPAAVAKYYDPMLDKFKKLLAEHPRPASITFCWMQGERDAKEQLSACYAEAMQQLIADLRRDLDRPDMRFVIGRLSDFGKPDDKHWQAVRKAQVEVANADPLGAWVDCDDLNDKEKDGVKRDDLHYTKEGYALLGRRFARQARALIDKQEPASNGRPE